jgi:hypothetical protein
MPDGTMDMTKIRHIRLPNVEGVGKTTHSRDEQEIAT